MSRTGLLLSSSAPSLSCTYPASPSTVLALLFTTHLTLLTEHLFLYEALYSPVTTDLSASAGWRFLLDISIVVLLSPSQTCLSPATELASLTCEHSSMNLPFLTVSSSTLQVLCSSPQVLFCTFSPSRPSHLTFLSMLFSILLSLKPRLVFLTLTWLQML